MDAVLGLSMTPTSFGLVLVEGQEADGATMDRSGFDVTHGAVATSEQATAAVLRTEADAATRGVRLHSIGLTWSDDADDQASELMQSLSESGFDNVVPVRLPEATEALARGMADVIGYETTAVCLVEPEAVITLIVNTGDGAVQTAFNHAIDTEDQLIGWLSMLFTKADWQPQALVVVGSAGGSDHVLADLENALSVPVFSPEEAELALARGAALASAVNVDIPFADATAATIAGGYPGHPRRLRLQQGAFAALAFGVVTFVAAGSAAVAVELSPVGVSTPAHSVSALAPAGPGVPEVRPTVPSAAPVAPPPPAAALPPTPQAPPVVERAPERPAPPVEAPVEAPVEPPVGIVPNFGLPAAPPAPNPATGAQPPVSAPPVPAQRPTLRSRIMDRLRGINDGPPQ